MTDSIAVHNEDRSPFYRVTGLPPDLGEAILAFFELSLAKGFSRRTIRAYAFDLVVFLRFYRGRHNKMPAFAKLDGKKLTEFIHQERGRNAAPASINRRLNTVDLFYRYCFGKLIPGTEAPNVDPTDLRRRHYLTMDAKLGIFPIQAKAGRTYRIRMPHRLVTALEPHEVNAFFSSIKSQRDRAIVMLMLICGLRCMEVITLELSDLNVLSRSLKVRGKGNKERILPVPDGVLAIVERYMEVERPARTKSEALFLVQKGPRRGMSMTLEGLRGVFRYHRAASHVRHANPHRFRHTFGRNMAAAGMSLPVLQKLLGHNDHRTTLKYINLTLQDVSADFEKAREKLRSLYAEPV